MALFRAVALLLILAPALRAQVVVPEADEWVREETAAFVVDDNAGGAEDSFFWADSQRQLLIRFCARLRLRLKPLTHGILYTRHLRHLPTGKLAIVDQGAIYAPLDPGYTVKTLANGAFFPLGASVLLDGRSAVVRPLEKEMTCREIRRDADLRAIKTVLPLEAGRIAAMRVGELWQIPMTLRLGANLSAVVPVPGLQATVSVGFSQQGASSVTLYRLAAKALRLRLRFDRASIFKTGGELVGMIPIAELGLPAAEKLIGRAFPPDTAAQINAFLGPRIGAGVEKTSGRRTMLEYILDPGDAVQMEALAALLQGDLDALLKLAALTTRTLADEDAAAKQLADAARAHASLGAPAFTGTAAYGDLKRGFEFGFPLLFDRQASGQKGRDQFVVLDAEGGKYTLERRAKNRAWGLLGMPGLGHLQERRSRRIAQSIVYRDAQGVSVPPSALYIQQQSFLEQSSRKTREMVEKIDEIMRLAGLGASLPLEAILPAREAQPDGDDVYSSPPHDSWGIMSFTLMFSRKAVASALSAAAPAIERAWTAALGSRRGVKDLIADLAAARVEATPEAQGAAFADLLSGKGRGRLAYEDVVKVLVQLVDPADLASEFFLQVDRNAYEGPDTLARYTFHKESVGDPVIRGARDLKARFAPPSLLGD